MSKKTYAFGIIFGIILSLSFSIGIFSNPNFTISEFFFGLSIEFIGWVVGISVFQSYYELRLKEKKKNQQSSSFSDELLALKKLMQEGILTEEEFQQAKKKLLQLEQN